VLFASACAHARGESWIRRRAGLPCAQRCDSPVSALQPLALKGFRRARRGALTSSMSYDAWGNPQTPGGVGAITAFGYAGGYTDADGLIYLINRYYDPSTGQFISVDPEVESTGEPYSYASSNPADNVDPLGMSTRYGVGMREICGPLRPLTAEACFQAQELCYYSNWRCDMQFETGFRGFPSNATMDSLYWDIYINGTYVGIKKYSHPAPVVGYVFHSNWGGNWIGPS
jgi:RHS repeat-associated protein